MNRSFVIVLLALVAGCARFQSLPISPGETAAALDRRSLASQDFKAFLEHNLHRELTEWPVQSWDFDMLTLAALYYHPSLDVARAEWQVAQGGEATAAQRPNPTVTGGPGYGVNYKSLGAPNPWMPLVNFDIPIETAGKRGYRKAQAGHLSEAARLNIAATAWQVRANLRSSLLDLSYGGLREALLLRQQVLQEKIVAALEQQLEAGAVSRSELMLVRVALDKTKLDLGDARQQMADARARVADAIGVSATAVADLELAADFVERQPDAAGLTSAEARSEALRSRPDVLGALAEYAASQSALQLEIARQYPDVHLGPGYQYNQGDNEFTLTAGVELPVLNQNQGPIAEAVARRAELAARFNELQARVISDIDRAVANFRVAGQNLTILSSLAATQRQQRDMVNEQVRAGAASQLDLLNAQLELDAGELVQLDGQAKIQQAYAALENAVQRPIDAAKSDLIERSQRPDSGKETQN